VDTPGRYHSALALDGTYNGYDDRSLSVCLASCHRIHVGESQDFGGGWEKAELAGLSGKEPFHRRRIYVD
jgi:hypothetical protein